MSVPRLFPSGVVNCLDSASRLCIQKSTYFSFTASTILSCVLLNCFAHVNCFARNSFNLIACDLFNWFARVWFNCFPRNYTFICRIFVERDLMIFLTIFLSPILFLLWVYTTTINGNASNVIEMCSTMFRICCTNFGLFITNIYIF